MRRKSPVQTKKNGYTYWYKAAKGVTINAFLPDGTYESCVTHAQGSWPYYSVNNIWMSAGKKGGECGRI